MTISLLTHMLRIFQRKFQLNNSEKARINVAEAFTDLVSQINNKLPQQKQFQTSSPNGGSSGCLGGCSCNIL